MDTGGKIIHLSKIVDQWADLRFQAFAQVK
jgi:hypothetical protein